MRYAFNDDPNPCTQVPYLYGGVRIDVEMFKASVAKDSSVSTTAGTFSLIDLPFSALLDTLLLPVAVPMQLKADDKCEQQQKAHSTPPLTNNSHP
ncbi:YceK/YidQ family lipoprotein [Gallaecimonas mangrovi]|uniref:YceK/YidQ family lipoprotein n=1 Tax=Gallaecimonas mangrovi TaxID=2291597 RepID=UPI0018680F07|nr:YceK/YidQ family lipoprotein [Gallaecimonas mangrovi]